MNKKQAELLRSYKIFNDYEITQKGHPFFSCNSAESRLAEPAYVALALKGRKFKNQAWYQNGNLWWSYHNKEGKARAVREAFLWVEKNFPGIKMVKSPFHNWSWVPEEDLKAALKTP